MQSKSEFQPRDDADLDPDTYLGTGSEDDDELTWQEAYETEFGHAPDDETVEEVEN